MSLARRFPPFVYFARRVDGEGPVKIGCSAWPENRLSSLLSLSPYALEIAATTPGDETLERRFHAHFKSSWSHREWFLPSPELTAVVAGVAANTFDLATLPAKGWSPPSKRLGTRWTLIQRLRARYANFSYRSGISESALFQRLVEWSSLTAAEQVALTADIEAYFADPLRFGVVGPHPWQRRSYAAFAERHGLPPLPKAEAA